MPCVLILLFVDCSEHIGLFPDLVTIGKLSVFNICMEVAATTMRHSGWPHFRVEATVIVCPIASFPSRPSSETIDAACILTECQIESDERASEQPTCLDLHPAGEAPEVWSQQHSALMHIRCKLEDEDVKVGGFISFPTRQN